MEKYTLNIGMEKSARFFKQSNFTKSFTSATVLKQVERKLKGVKLVNVKTAQSKTEKTLIIQLETNMTAQELHSKLLALSDKLAQDCVAVYSHTQDAGKLVGTYASIWGEFDKQYFLL